MYLQGFGRRSNTRKLFRIATEVTYQSDWKMPPSRFITITPTDLFVLSLYYPYRQCASAPTSENKLGKESVKQNTTLGQQRAVVE